MNAAPQAPAAQTLPLVFLTSSLRFSPQPSAVASPLFPSLSSSSEIGRQAKLDLCESWFFLLLGAINSRTMMPRDVIIDVISDQQQHSSTLAQNNNGNDRRRTIMATTEEGFIVDVISDQQQHSSPLIQNNNGNERSLTSTGVGAQEKSTPITDLLENKVAKMLGALVCGWVLLVLVQGGMVGSLETKDCGFVTLLFFLVFCRCWRHYCPQAYRSFTEATQSLSADYLSVPNDIQQLALPSCYIRGLFYCSSLVSAMTSAVLSVMRLASQDFGKKKVANMESRDFALKVFYGLTLAEALVLLFALTLSFSKKRSSMALADGPGDGSEDGPGDRPENGSEDGPGNGPGDRPEGGPEDGPGGEPEDVSENGPGGEPGDVPVNQSNEWNAVAQMDRPANQSNDLNSEGSADSLPNLRQRRREIPQLPRVGLEMPAVPDVATAGMELGGGSGDGNVFEATNAEVSGTRRHVRGAPEGSSGSGRGPTVSSGQRNTRRRRDNGAKVMQRVPAGRPGNNEMPPDDGYTWRKYGQKDILGCRFPRSYFRCTHKNYYGCEAEKQVQRLDEDPYTYEIVYCGQHSCLTSTTPLLTSSLALMNTGVTSAVAPINTTPTVHTSNVTTNPHIESSMIGTAQVQMQPSTSIHLGNWLTRDLGEGRPVADMADVLFNSGSSSSSMDAIFSSQHEN